MIERHELADWPSITGWLLLEAVDRIYNEDPLVLGLADFAQKYSIRYQGIERRVRFEPLPGVEHEARDVAEKLRVKPRLGDGATGAELFTRRRGCPIVHLATHGLLDETDPEASFVALADGPLTAHELYQNDSGIRCGLVIIERLPDRAGACSFRQHDWSDECLPYCRGRVGRIDSVADP